METLQVEYKPSEKKLKEMEVNSWPLWISDPGVYEHEYEMPETCFFFEGEATLVPEEGDEIEIMSGTLINIPAPFKCKLQISKTLKMRYLLG